MIWRIPNGCRVQSADVDGVSLWLVEISGEAIPSWTIGLTLLGRELIQRLDIVAEGGNCQLQIERLARVTNARALVAWNDDVVARLCLSTTELEMWITFFLKTVRDGVAEVDHIDLEADPYAERDRRGDFVIKFPESSPPISAEKARRRLGF